MLQHVIAEQFVDVSDLDSTNYVDHDSTQKEHVKYN